MCYNYDQHGDHNTVIIIIIIMCLFQPLAGHIKTELHVVVKTIINTKLIYNKLL